MKLLSLFSFLFFCTITTQAATPVVILCPPEAYTPGMPPKVIFTINKTKKIAVCGAEEANKSSLKRKLVSEFAVYSVDAKGKFSSPLREFSSQDVYYLRPTKKGLLFEQVVLMSTKWVPVFASTLNCAREFCTFSDNKCVYKAKGKPDRNATKDLRVYYEGVKKGQVPDEELIYRVVNAALLGDKEAQFLLVDKPKDLRLEGSIAEDYNEGAILIRRLKTDRCL